MCGVYRVRGHADAYGGARAAVEGICLLRLRHGGRVRRQFELKHGSGFERANEYRGKPLVG